MRYVILRTDNCGYPLWLIYVAGRGRLVCTTTDAAMVAALVAEGKAHVEGESAA